MHNAGDASVVVAHDIGTTRTGGWCACNCLCIAHPGEARLTAYMTGSCQDELAVTTTWTVTTRLESRKVINCLRMDPIRF